MSYHKKPSESSDKYFQKQLKFFVHPSLDGLIIGVPSVNKPIVQDLYTLKLSSVSGVPGTVGEFADLELFSENKVRKINDKIKKHNLVDLNWPDWQEKT